MARAKSDYSVLDYFFNVSVDGIGNLEVALINIARFALSVFERATFFTLVKEIYISINNIILEFIAIKKKENERLSKQKYYYHRAWQNRSFLRGLSLIPTG